MSTGGCESVTFQVQGKRFFVAFLVLTLEGCDVVLGVQWLKTLGPIVWVFMKMSMEFQIMGSRTVLQGLCIGDTSVKDGSSFCKPSFAGKKAWVLQIVYETETQ